MVMQVSDLNQVTVFFQKYSILKVQISEIISDGGYKHNKPGKRDYSLKVIGRVFRPKSSVPGAVYGLNPDPNGVGGTAMYDLP